MAVLSDVESELEHELTLARAQLIRERRARELRVEVGHLAAQTSAMVSRRDVARVIVGGAADLFGAGWAMMAYVVEEESGFLGSTRHKQYSEHIAQEIDGEVRRIITEEYKRARDMIEANRDKLDAIAEALLERETIGKPEIEAILEDRELPPPEQIIIPSYAEKRAEAKEKRKGSIFQPRPREVPSTS